MRRQEILYRLHQLMEAKKQRLREEEEKSNDSNSPAAFAMANINAFEEHIANEEKGAAHPDRIKMLRGQQERARALYAEAQKTGDSEHNNYYIIMDKHYPPRGPKR